MPQFEEVVEEEVAKDDERSSSSSSPSSKIPAKHKPVDPSIPPIRLPTKPRSEVKPLGPRVNLTEDGGVFKRLKTEGDASRGKPKLGDLVTIHYVAMHGKDGVLFDSSRKQMNAGGYSYTLGSTESIKDGMPRPRGWDIAMMSMNVGECSLITLSPDYAYGKHGVRQPPRPGFTVPPHVTVTYNIELVDYGKAKENMTPREKLDQGLMFCDKGNSFFASKEFAKSKAQYELALEVLQTFPGVRHDMPSPGDGDADETTNVEESREDIRAEEDRESSAGTPHALEARGAIVRCLSNIATCLTQIKPVDWKAVHKNCDQALWVHDDGGLQDPKLVGKVLYRRAEAYLRKGESEAARKDLNRAFKLLPDSKPVRKLLKKVQEQVRLERDQRKEMFGNLMVSGKATGMYNDKKDVEIREDDSVKEMNWFSRLEVFVNDNKFMFIAMCTAIILSSIFSKTAGVFNH